MIKKQNDQFNLYIVFTLFILIFLISINLIPPTGAGCGDGWASSSIGSRGACSHHGGVRHSNLIIYIIGSVYGAFILADYWSKILKNKHVSRAVRIIIFFFKPTVFLYSLIIFIILRVIYQILTPL